MFQFDPAGIVVMPQVREVLRQLLSVCDESERAWWFVLPNVWLAGQAPVDALDRDSRAVLDAARADRYVANW